MTGRFLAGRTRDVSAGGAMLLLDHPSLLVPGQRLEVGIAQSLRQAIMPRQTMVPATVVRAAGMLGRQTVALVFDRVQEMALAM